MLKRVYEYYSYRISKFYKEKLKANNPYYFANAIFFLSYKLYRSYSNSYSTYNI